MNYPKSLSIIIVLVALFTVTKVAVAQETDIYDKALHKSLKERNFTQADKWIEKGRGLESTYWYFESLPLDSISYLVGKGLKPKKVDQSGERKKTLGAGGCSATALFAEKATTKYGGTVNASSAFLRLYSKFIEGDEEHVFSCVSKYGDLLLSFVARKGAVSGDNGAQRFIDLLVKKHGAKEYLNAFDLHGRWSWRAQNVAGLRYLAENGVDMTLARPAVSQCGSNRRVDFCAITPFIRMLLRDDVESLQYLMTFDVDINQKFKVGDKLLTALDIAKYASLRDSTKLFLVENGALYSHYK